MNEQDIDLEQLKMGIYSKVNEYMGLKQERENGNTFKRPYIGYAGAVYDHEEIIAMMDSILEGWFALGKRGVQFADQLSKYIGARSTVLTNSGSSANLIAVSALTSHLLENPLREGDEVITTACSFPTTVNPIIQNRLSPVFVDIRLGDYNIDVDEIKNAITNKTRAIMFAHTLANPADMDRIMQIANDHNLIVIEDCCDALGSEYRGKKLGTFGLLSTCSFFPAHHITTAGEGGAVFINGGRNLNRIVNSFTSWGRDCWCSTDETTINGACQRRFDFTLDGIPYDHRFVYSHIGYNLKPTEVQAAMGLAQLKKLDKFIDARKRNFQYLYNELKRFEDYLILPEWFEHSDPAWFAFPITIREEASIDRQEFVQKLQGDGIQTRNLFAGNLLRHPAYKKQSWKVASDLKNSDIVMKNSFFVGVYPGLTESNLAFMVDKIGDYIRLKS